MGGWVCEVDLRRDSPGTLGSVDRTTLAAHRTTELSAVIAAVRLVLAGRREQIAAEYDHPQQLAQILGLGQLTADGGDTAAPTLADCGITVDDHGWPQARRGGIRFPSPIDRYVAGLADREIQQSLTRLLDALWTPGAEPTTSADPVADVVSRINCGDRAREQLGKVLDWLQSHFPGPHIDQAVTAFSEGPTVDPAPVARQVIAHLEETVAPGREARAELDRLAERLAENYVGYFDPSRPPVDSATVLLHQWHGHWVQLTDLAQQATRVLGEDKTGQPIVADPAAPLWRLVDEYRRRVLDTSGRPDAPGPEQVRLRPAAPDPAQPDRCEQTHEQLPVTTTRAGLPGPADADSPELVAALQQLGTRWGPLGVALAAARLTDRKKLADTLFGKWQLIPATTVDLTPQRAGTAAQ